MTDTKERTFQIRSDGQMVVFDGNNDAAENEPKRGDIEFVKVGEGASPRLANVPFLVTNKASGEAHVVVTDANGQMKTSSDWNKHTVRTNASDAAVDADGDGVFTDEEKAAVDESKLDCNAGTWFGLNPDTGKLVPASDGKGALRWGDYTVEELRVGANKGYELVKMDISVRRHGVTIDMGTIVDEKPYVKTPWIGTSARDGADGDRILVADPEAVVVDRVEYANLEAGELYRVVGVLMDKAAGEPVRDAQGNPVTAEKSFVAEDVKGYVELAFGFDATSVEGDVVVFEALYKDGSDEPVAKHEDIDDYYQTVKVYEPSIGTTLLDGLDGDKTVVADDTVTLVDTVAYRNMPVGKECTVTGTLMVAGEEPAPLMRPVLDESGAPVLDEAPDRAGHRDRHVHARRARRHRRGRIRVPRGRHRGRYGACGLRARLAPGHRGGIPRGSGGSLPDGGRGDSGDRNPGHRCQGRRQGDRGRGLGHHQRRGPLREPGARPRAHP